MGFPVGVQFMKEGDDAQPCQQQQDAYKNIYQSKANEVCYQPPRPSKVITQLEFKFTFPKAQLELFDGR